MTWVEVHTAAWQHAEQMAPAAAFRESMHESMHEFSIESSMEFTPESTLDPSEFTASSAIGQQLRGQHKRRCKQACILHKQQVRVHANHRISKPKP